MALILDTNAVSAFADGDRDLLPTISQETRLAIPSVVLGEYLFGITGSRMRPQYEKWLDDTLRGVDVLDIGAATARHYAQIRRELKTAGRPLPTNDLWIAALAREHHFPIVTRDHHFTAVQSIRILSW